MQSTRTRGGRAFLARILVATLAGLTPEEFAEQEVRAIKCRWCREGWPAVRGQHNIRGVNVRCDAASRVDTPADVPTVFL